MCTAAILAGGKARRLGGRPKGLLAFGGASIIEHQITVLREITDDLIIVANRPAAYAAFGVPVVEDLIPGAGALGGIYTAIMTAGGARTLVIACDMPFLQAPFLRYVLGAGRTVDVAIPRTATGYEPLCASYARTCRTRMRHHIETGILKVQDLLMHVRVRELGPREIAPYDADGLLFCNVNTPDEYARACLAVRRQ